VFGIERLLDILSLEYHLGNNPINDEFAPLQKSPRLNLTDGIVIAYVEIDIKTGELALLDPSEMPKPRS
jgi:hypothetical protein